jgi:hypothetical protein
MVDNKHKDAEYNEGDENTTNNFLMLDKAEVKNKVVLLRNNKAIHYAFQPKKRKRALLSSSRQR